MFMALPCLFPKAFLVRVRKLKQEKQKGGGLPGKRHPAPFLLALILKMPNNGIAMFEE